MFFSNIFKLIILLKVAYVKNVSLVCKWWLYTVSLIRTLLHNTCDSEVIMLVLFLLYEKCVNMLNMATGLKNLVKDL